MRFRQHVDTTMKRQPVRYAIVRLRPDIETEEFANVGIVLVAPESNYFDYRMETRRTGRLEAFFPRAGAAFLNDALLHTARELTRIRELAESDSGTTRRAELLFASLTKDREGVVGYSDIRHAIHAEPRTFIDELFDRYVLRSMIERDTPVAAAGGRA